MKEVSSNAYFYLFIFIILFKNIVFPSTPNNAWHLQEQGKLLYHLRLQL